MLLIPRDRRTKNFKRVYPKVFVFLQLEPLCSEVSNYIVYKSFHHHVIVFQYLMCVSLMVLFCFRAFCDRKVMSSKYRQGQEALAL